MRLTRRPSSVCAESAVMRFTLGSAFLVVAVVSLSLPADAAEELPVAPYPRFGVPVDDLKKDLTKALGDDFEFVDGEIGHVEQNWSSMVGRFWFAKVRPKKAGDFAIMYTVRFEYPPEI